MNRRNVLKVVASAFSGAGLLGMGVNPARAEGRKSGTMKSKSSSTPLIETRDGVGLFYRDWGKGRPVVFAAPWAMGSDWWEYQMVFLASQGLRCIAFDRRGHGRSDEPSGGYDFNTFADDLNSVIERFDLHQTTLVGQSMGCGEVVRYLSRHGAARVERIVLIGTVTPFLLKTEDNPDGMDASYFERVRHALCSDRPNAIAGYAPVFFGAPKNAVSSEMMRWFTDMILRCSLRVMLDVQHAFSETDFRSDLRAVAVPTLVIHGDNDAGTPFEITGRKTAALISGSQLTVYEGAAHGLNITHAEHLNQDLLAFIRR